MAKTTATGTGQHSTVAPSRGSSLTKTTVGHQSTRSIKAPMSPNKVQAPTPPPAVKMPRVTMVTDSKARTAREQRVDAYNAMNKSHAGGTQYQTALEQEYVRIAGGNHPGTESTTTKRPKQAQ